MIDIKLLYATPLSVVEKAINTCWDKHNTCKVGEVNTDKLTRVIRKFKHASTAEHGRFVFNFTINNLIDLSVIENMKNNKYFIVEKKENKLYTISTNLRAIIESDISSMYKEAMVSEEYYFLIRNEDE